MTLSQSQHLPLVTELNVCLQCFDAAGWAAGRASGLQKTEWWGAGMVICLEQGADLHIAQLLPLPLTVSCFTKIQIGFTFLVLAHLGSPGKRAVKRMCVCVSDGIEHRTSTVILYELVSMSVFTFSAFTTATHTKPAPAICKRSLWETWPNPG